MSDIAERLDLAEAETAAAKRAALQWIYIGPCRKPGDDLGAGADSSVALIMGIGAGITTRFGIAILAMATVLERENLGREPPENVCRFALELGRERGRK